MVGYLGYKERDGYVGVDGATINLQRLSVSSVCCRQRNAHGLGRLDELGEYHEEFQAAFYTACLLCGSIATWPLYQSSEPAPGQM